MATEKKKLQCTFDQDLIKEPLLYSLGRNFNIVPNVRKAQVDEEKAFMTLELEGEGQDIADAIAWLLERGAEIDELD